MKEGKVFMETAENVGVCIKKEISREIPLHIYFTNKLVICKYY